MKINKLIPLLLAGVLLASCAPVSTSSELSSSDPSSSLTSKPSTSEQTSKPSTSEQTSKPSTSEQTSKPSTSEEQAGHNYQTDYHGYYKTINDSMSSGQNGSLRTTLTKLIKPRGHYSYSGSGKGDLGYELREFDEDPNNPNNMIMFYTQQSIKKKSSNVNEKDGWNREHTWPQSNSAGLYGKTGGGADVLHIRPTYVKTNSARGNLRFGYVGGSYDTYNGVPFARIGKFFEPLDSVKGDCARICMYMWVTYFAERGTKITNNFESIERMLEWHRLDPVSQIEKNRNDLCVKTKQGNRNPFVDYPDFAEKIFG